MNRNVEAVLNVLLTASAVVMSTAFVYRVATRDRHVEIGKNPKRIDDWEALKAGHLRIGSEQATLQVVEFGDFECPFCKNFHDTFNAVFARLPNDVSLVYRHFPISN